MAAVAALSTVVGIFTKTDSASIHISWEIATAMFVGLIVFWIAIWAIDRFYYTRLLIGAVIALREFEKEGKKPNPNLAIGISSTIELYAGRALSDDRPRSQKFQSKIGVRIFYGLVLLALIVGAWFCYSHELQTRH